MKVKNTAKETKKKAQNIESNHKAEQLFCLRAANGHECL